MRKWVYAGIGATVVLGIGASVAVTWYVAWVRAFDWQDDSFLNDAVNAQNPGSGRWRDRNKQR